MPMEGLLMRQIREILRLRWACGLPQRAVARACGVGLGTVSEYGRRAAHAGIGKSWLADAFAARACRAGYSAYRVRVPRLLHDLAVARGDGSYTRLLAKLAKTALLVLDDWGLTPLTGPQRHDVLEVLEDRTERASTLLTTQLPLKAWHEAIGDPTLADAICDRLVHTAHVLDLRGPSMRDPKTRAHHGHPDPGPAEPGRAPTKPAGSARKEAKRPDPKHGS